MPGKKRITGIQWFKASVSAILLSCIFASLAQAESHLYTYPLRGEEDVSPRDIAAGVQPPEEEQAPSSRVPYREYRTERKPSVSISTGPPNALPALIVNSQPVPGRSAALPPQHVLRLAAAPAIAAAVVPASPVNVVTHPMAVAAVQPIPVNGGAVAVAGAMPKTEMVAAPLSVPVVAASVTPVISPSDNKTVSDLAQLAPASGKADPVLLTPPVAVATILPAAPAAAAPAIIPPLPPSSSLEEDAPAANAEKPLSDKSKEILQALPAQKSDQAKKKPPVDIEHFRKTTLEGDNEVKEHEGVGIKISIKHSKVDTNRLLEEAYNALIAGNQEDAVNIYKEVLAVQPNNKLALFGLATTYHRAGQLQLARPLYGQLLAIDPNNVEGLNNFLVLIADESPQSALAELDKLEQTHPGFSPVPAQIATIYEKAGDYDKAIAAMGRAIDLSPENLKYRYNMAIMLDKKGDWADAAVFYQQLIAAGERGAILPTSSEEIQNRLTFIRSNVSKAPS